MATDFFERQSQARTSTGWLIAMVVLAVVGIVIVVSGLAFAAIQLAENNRDLPVDDELSWMLPLMAGLATVLLILGGSLFKVLELRNGGGTCVAERLGGKRIYPNTEHSVERRLLNVVEEMAIASGTPVPPVFLLAEEQGINAFAAGYSPSDAVLGITRGCAERLTRDELQGVIAHEFSHVLNGDMRMSIRLIGILHGILLLGLVGQMLFRMLFYTGGTRHRSSSSKNNSGQAALILMLIAVGLILIGFIGTLFGNLIKAAVSRQREYLADASAVQFTRNPLGIAGALKKIGAVSRGARLEAAEAAEASHMYFAKGVWEGFTGLWATHPPLAKRILAVDPSWDGEFPPAEKATQIASDLAIGFAGDSAGDLTHDYDVPPEHVDHAIDQVGEPQEGHRQYAADLLATLPPGLMSAVREPYGARAVVFCLLMDKDEQIKAQQFASLEATAEDDLVLLTKKLLPQTSDIDARARLPLIDLALPALRAMSLSQYQRFAQCFDDLVKADDRMDLFEWVLSRVLMRHLRPQFEPVRSPRVHYYGLQQLAEPCSILLSAVAYAGHAEAEAQPAFDAAASRFSEVKLTLLRPPDCRLSALRTALAKLNEVAAKQRGRLVDACATSICFDQQVNWREAELLRGISDLLDCPMPPLLVRQAD